MSNGFSQSRLMATSSDPVLDESLKCLWAHCHPEWGDRVPLDVFNRLLAKTIKPHGWTPNTHLDIQPQQISSQRERRPTEALARLRRGHSSTAGEDFDCPIVVAHYAGTKRLLDGNHRINRWIEVGDARLHDVNIHTIAAVGSFIELPAVHHGA
jgi:hypothetical protein